MFIPLPPYPFALFSISIPPDTVYRHFIPFSTSPRRQFTTRQHLSKHKIREPFRQVTIDYTSKKLGSDVEFKFGRLLLLTLESYRFARHTHVCRYNLVAAACRDPSILLHYTVRGSHMRSHESYESLHAHFLSKLQLSSRPHPLILCMSVFLVMALNYHKILKY